MTDQTIYFSEEKSEEAVIARMDRARVDPRLHQVVASLVKHLHAFIKDVEPTNEEWMQGIKFLTETGQMCNDWRQEFILLSDTLGVSMLVETVNNRKPSGATEATVLGPFYVEGAPHLEHGANISLDGKGEPMVVRGRVTDVEGRPIAGALLDVWQANEDGFYDVQQKGVQPDMNLRGVFAANPDGRCWFLSAKPNYYPVPDDGPVGKLLKALKRHPSLPSGACSLHCQRKGLRADHHPYFHARQPVPRQRRRVWREGELNRGLCSQRERLGCFALRVQPAFLGSRVRFRAVEVLIGEVESKGIAAVGGLAKIDETKNGCQESKESLCNSNRRHRRET